MASGVEKNSGLNLLWTNPSPDSAFSPQTVSVDLSKYSVILIEFAYNTNAGNGTYFSIFATSSSRSNHYTFTNINITSGYSGQPTSISRSLSFTQDGIAFGNGEQKDPTASSTTPTTVNNVRCIPLKIWGL